MHIQIINFNLEGVSEQEYRNLCDQLAPNFADLPGLVSKSWLADPASNTYGGVYFWRDKESMVNFTKTELFNSVATHPNLANIASKDFEILEGPTRVTRGLEEARV